MRDDELTRLLFDRQLVSVMNRTKWRELAQAMMSNESFEPTVRLGYLDGYETGFSQLDWDWVKNGETRVIKWLEIDPIRRERVGRLVTPLLTDFSDWVRAILTKHAIPFVESDDIFRIDGYLQPNNS